MLKLMLMFLLLWLWWVSKFLRSGMLEMIGCYCRNLGTSKTGQPWSSSPWPIWLGRLRLTYPDPLPAESKQSHPFLIYWTSNHTHIESDWEKKKRRQRDFFIFWVVFSTIYLLVVLKRMGPTESTKKWVMKFCKYLTNRCGIEIGVFWVMSDGNWVRSEEWGVRSDGKKKNPNKA